MVEVDAMVAEAVIVSDADILSVATALSGTHPVAQQLSVGHSSIRLVQRCDDYCAMRRRSPNGQM